MRIPLDRQGQLPLYQQIESYLRQGILSGSLPAETRLPACRKLARDLGVNRTTVENAYSELEADGLVFSRMGSGTYVLPANPLPAISKNISDADWPLWQQSVQDRNIALATQFFIRKWLFLPLLKAGFLRHSSGKRQIAR